MIQVGDIVQVVKSRWIPLGTKALIVGRKAHGMDGNEFLHATLLGWTPPRHGWRSHESVRLKEDWVQVVSAARRKIV